MYPLPLSVFEKEPLPLNVKPKSPEPALTKTDSLAAIHPSLEEASLREVSKLAFKASSRALEEALNASLDTSRKLASSREGWIAARESVFVSAGSGDFGLTLSGSGSFSNTDSGSGYKKSDTYSNKITLSKNVFDFGKATQNTMLAEINLDPN